MGIFDFLFDIFKRKNNRSRLDNPDSWLLNSGAKALAGRYVDQTTALKTSGVFACVRIIAETIASMPLILYRQTEQGRERYTKTPVYNLLKLRPNPETSAYILSFMIGAHLNLWGNFYGQIIWNGDGIPKEIWPLLPNKMTVERNTKTLEIDYKYNDDTTHKTIYFKPWEIIHIKLFTIDGLTGLSPIGYARESIGLSLAMEEFGARFFGNGTNLGGIASHPTSLSDEAWKHLKESINEKYAGIEKSHRIMILEEGMKFEKLGIPPEDAQFIESRKFQLEDIARIYRVPLHLLGALDRATFNNVEQMSTEFIYYSTKPTLTNIEQEYNYKLFVQSGRDDIYAEYLVDSLLRGDIQTRFEAYSKARTNGWMSANEIRTLENMNKIDGGDTVLSPLNYIPASKIDEYYQWLLNTKKGQ